MATCSNCGEHTSMPYSCSYCGQPFCSNHRLPENHECQRIDRAASPSTDTVTKESLRDAARYYREKDAATRPNWLTVVAALLLLTAIVTLFVLY